MPNAVPRRRQPHRMRTPQPDLISRAERERRIADLIQQALELLKVERLGTTRRSSSDDDDEDPTRRLGGAKPRLK